MGTHMKPVRPKRNRAKGDTRRDFNDHGDQCNHKHYKRTLFPFLLRIKAKSMRVPPGFDIVFLHAPQLSQFPNI